jgi:S-adenosylmethionine:diacylglycerol 3-amino-3-carboxypropyl transferase
MGFGELSGRGDAMSGQETAWTRGRFDRRGGPSKLLFGRMHEDSAIELQAFRECRRVFCIASAGCTAMALAPRHEVVAADINPVQIAYVRRRFSGEPAVRGAAERMMAFWRGFAPLAGWSRARVREFLDLDDPAEQIVYWHRHLDTRRFRTAMELLLARPLLGLLYAKPFLRSLPGRFGRILRRRMERAFSLHPNRGNPFARALLLAEPPQDAPPPEAKDIRLVLSDAAAYLEVERPQSFDGFTLSNVLDGATDGYRDRLAAAVRRAAAPGAVVVIRSFGEPLGPSPGNRAAEDRAMLWGIVRVLPAAAGL